MIWATYGGSSQAQSENEGLEVEQLAILHQAEAFTINPDGAIFVATERGRSIIQLDADTFYPIEHYGIPGELDRVSALHISQRLEIYLADRSITQIARYARGFRLSGIYGVETSEQPFTDIDDFKVDAQRRIYAVSRRDGLMAYWEGSAAPEIIGGLRDGPGELVEPVSIALFGSSSVLVADAGAGSIMEFDRWGNYSRVLLSGLTPSFIAVHEGDIWVLDGARLIQLDYDSGVVRDLLFEIPGRVLGMAATDAGLFFLTSGALYRLR